jgi:hypothetical protein
VGKSRQLEWESSASSANQAIVTYSDVIHERVGQERLLEAKRKIPTERHHR